MNLYEIGKTHYAPKDSEYGIQEYVVANNDDQVFKYLAEGYAYWNDILEYAEEDKNEYAQEEYDTIRENHSDDREVYDLYYGATQYCWKQCDNVRNEVIQGMIESNLAKDIRNVK